jgi:hypothetical protein
MSYTGTVHCRSTSTVGVAHRCVNVAETGWSFVHLSRVPTILEGVYHHYVKLDEVNESKCSRISLTQLNLLMVSGKIVLTFSETGGGFTKRTSESGTASGGITFGSSGNGPQHNECFELLVVN